MLQALELRSRQQASTSGHMHGDNQGGKASTAAAMRAWGRVGKRERQALKRAHFAVVHALEVNLLQQMAQVAHLMLLTFAAVTLAC